MCAGCALNKDRISSATQITSQKQEKGPDLPLGKEILCYTGCFASCSLLVVLPPGKWKVRGIRDSLGATISSWVLAFKHSYLGAHFLAHQKYPGNFGLHVYQSLQYCYFLQLTDIRDAGRARALESSVFQDTSALGVHKQLTFLEANDMSSTRTEPVNTGNLGE